MYISFTEVVEVQKVIVNQKLTHMYNLKQQVLSKIIFK